jgi:hypothetical protein
MTLQELYDKNPGWRTLPLTVYRSDGEIDYVGASGGVYEGEGSDGELVLVFASNE